MVKNNRYVRYDRLERRSMLAPPNSGGARKTDRPLADGDAYDRARCVTDLMLRQGVLANLAKGRGRVPDFQIHAKPRARPLGPNGEETSTAPDTSPGSDNSTFSAQRIGEMDTDDNSPSVYAEPV